MRDFIADVSNGLISPAASQAVSNRRGPIAALILCGCFLAAGIVTGTALMVNEFRERALSHGERELENTVLLLTRHFDQQFEDSNTIAHNVIAQMDIPEFSSAE